MRKGRVIVVDDEFHMRELICETLRRNHLEVEAVPDGPTALDVLAQRPADLVITDVKMPKMSGLALLKDIKQSYPRVKVVMITAYGTIEDAVTAMREGAFDYVQKPFAPEELMLRAEKVFEYRDLVQENANLKHQLGTRFRFDNIVGTSPKMLQLYETLEMVSATKANVLIQGESGTGKELVARAIHENSPNRTGPFIKVNCAALPDTLMESELFGHEKGAFTGAIKTVEGRFSLAHDGTLLLDEISEMSPNMQAKLLRVLQEREFERLGGRETIKTNARIIATTNRELKALVRQEKFREDLYYRLNVCPIFLPPLTQRKEDIPLLANHFLDIYSKDYGRAIECLTEATLEVLFRYHWPGNVRELENAIARAVVMCPDSRIDVKHLAIDDLEGSSAIPLAPEGSLPITLWEIERAAIFRALSENNNNRTKTADMLGISIRTLRNKLREYRAEGVAV
ncbi:MAG: sigma-54-dependent Fis family transcriptional regulator [Calditrichaeota bacterium]|nr:sigma-54-dependent Fis family transcriptional regulator [Calditrichota bacterium]